MAARLRDEQWQECTFAEITDGWLRAEQHKLREKFVEWKRPDLVRRLDRHLARAPDFSDDDANADQVELLASFRAPLLNGIPANTAWFRVSSLRNIHLEQIHVIGRCGWEDQGQSDHNEVRHVAKRKVKKGETWNIERGPDSWGFLLLWGHHRGGPFTILEGNNRLVEYAATPGAPDFAVPVYIGLSPNYCFWHLPDPAFLCR